VRISQEVAKLRLADVLRKVILVGEEYNVSNQAEQRLLNPAPGSAIETARDFGIDLTLLIERLRLTPEERVRQLQQAMIVQAQIRGAARKIGGRSKKEQE